MSNKKQFFEDFNKIAAEKTIRKEQGNDKDTSEKFYKPDSEGDKKEPDKEETKKPEDTAAQPPVTPGIDAEKSGQTSAILAAGCLETIFMLAERLMFIYGRFSSEEKEAIIKIQDKDESDLSAREKEINRKFIRITAKHDDIRSKINFDEKEMEAMAEGFAEYTRITGKSLSPKLILWATGTKAVASRAMDIFL